MVYLKMLRDLALMQYENKLYWKSLGAEIVQRYDMGIEIHSDVTPSYVLMWSHRRGL
jgi:hypothetical protein